MPDWIVRCICSVFIGLLILEVSTIRTLGQVQTPTSPFDFQPPFEREMKAGEKHTYPVRLKANDFLKLDVVQKGIDVVVRLLGPDMKVMVEVD
ncbi:MAG TPA: hypothetical protein PLS70_22770, partial [Acidobacteriota bacterium]|nr:hypothetical protein [Acidobacteriota bacterium]